MKRPPARRALALVAATIGVAALVTWLAVRAPPRGASGRVLERFDTPAGWMVDASDDVRAALRTTPGRAEGALQLDFDFRGRSGHAGLRRPLALDWPDNFELSLYVRGDAPPNDLQLKLSDASGDNVWWFRRPALELAPGWTRLRFTRRELEFAWGPAQDHALRHSAALELVLAAGQGGKGSVAFDDLTLQELPLPPAVPPPPVASASASAAGAPAALASDGRLETAWRSDGARGAEPTLELDLGYQRPFGGLSLDWAEGAPATRYDVELSRDGVEWQLARRVEQGNGGHDAVRLPDAEARWLRIALHAGPLEHYALAEAVIEPPEFGRPNSFVQALARRTPRGQLPRAFAGEQNTWTLVGTDGGADSALLSEDGALEVGAGGFSIEPFVVAGERLWTWADVALTQSLREGYLPLPSVRWQSPEWQLVITTWAADEPAPARVLARYELESHSPKPIDLRLVLAVRPLQVNPPAQSLNLAGGVSPIGELDWDGRRVRVNGARSVEFLAPPDHVQLSAFDAAELPVRLSAEHGSGAQRVTDATELASGLFGYDVHLAPAGSVRLALLAPLAPPVTSPPAACSPVAALPTLAELERSEQQVAAHWHAQLDRVELRVPPLAQPVVDTLRTSLAYILMSRAGPLLRPGTRSYARSWIRDGALMSEALLQLGHAGVVASYLDAFAAYQFDGGKVPCCVDARGADPVPEHDSPGELIFLAAELYRFTGERAALERAWPHVAAAAGYLEQLRAQERTAANQTPERRAYYGLLPRSISHEGYSDKPAYSYWDDFWALIGYQDVAFIAQEVGQQEAGEHWARVRDQFRADLYASLNAVVADRGLAFLPASADRGDLDPTATTLALAPGREAAALPPELLRGTFERYWQSFEERRTGPQRWEAYTPYELRVIGSFVRLGWRERAQQLLQYFLADRSPLAWNGWPEVVAREPRAARFIGDRPHAWIASDYIRSVLDLFAYARASDHAIVLAAGISPKWLEESGVTVQRLQTSFGAVDYSAVQVGQNVQIEIRGRAPEGGFVLPWLWQRRRTPARVWINGAALRWEGDELRITSVPAHIVVELGPARRADE